MKNTSIKEVMSPELFKVQSDVSIQNAAKVMKSHEIGSILIESNGIIIGVVTERDVLRKVVAEGRDPEKTKVKDIMNFPVVTVPPEYTLDDVVYLMSTLKIRRVVVEEDGQAIGVVSVRDVIQNQLTDMDNYKNPDDV